MRKFTKEHNDLTWLFPKRNDEYYDPVKTFEHFEEIANNKFEIAHNNENTFSKDDLIDAFMKGASIAIQHSKCFYSGLSYEKRKLKELENNLENVIKILSKNKLKASK